MADEELFVPEDSPEAYEPMVPVVHKSHQDYDDFWSRLLAEADEADALALAGGAVYPDPAEEAAAEDAPQPSFEERYEKLMDVVSNKPSHREILLRTLSLCTTDQEFGAVEAAIQEYPEYPAAGQNPFRLITYLVEGGGLEQYACDSEGAEIDAARKAGLTEDEVDDLTAAFMLRATDVGRKVAEDHTTERRLTDLYKMFTDRASYYTELLDFCKQPRTFKDIEALFSGRDLASLRTLHPESGLAIKPSVFIDHMEKAGAIVWQKDGWVLTKEGGAYLETILHGSV